MLDPPGRRTIGSMIDFDGKVAVVTGGSRGIGAAATRLLCELGARVAFSWRSAREEAEALVEELGGSALARRVDVRREDEVAALVAAAEEAWGGVDVAVANAGIWEAAPIDSMTGEQWARTIDVNLGGTYRLARHAVPALRRRGGGAIVVSTSTAGQRGEAGHAHYAASKGGQISLVKSLAVELAPAIRVNGVAPGWVDTEMSAIPLDEDRERILAEIPLNRVATADDVAAGIAFLASDRARHVTGEILNVNGGSVLCG